MLSDGPRGSARGTTTSLHDSAGAGTRAPIGMTAGESDVGTRTGARGERGGGPGASTGGRGRWNLPPGALALWVMVAVLLLFLPATYISIRHLEGMGARRDQAVALLRARRELVLEMVRATERAPDRPISPETEALLLSFISEIQSLGESESGQLDTIERVRLAIDGATRSERGPILSAVQPSLDALYARDQQIVDGYRLQFAEVGIRGPYILLTIEAAVTAGLVLAGWMLMREFRRRDAVERELWASRERLAGSERLARLGHWELEIATQRLTMSDTMHEILGIPRRFFGGTASDVIAVVHPDDRSRVRDTMAEMVSRPRTVFDQFRVMVEGQVRVIFQRGTPVLDDRGALVRVFGTAQDVTEQTRSEQALRESDARFRALADFAPVVVFQARPDGSVTYISPRWLAVTGVSPERSLGWAWVDCIHPEDRDRVVESWRESAERGEPWAHEHRIRRADGQERWLRVMACAITRDGEDPSGYVGTAEDVTDRICANREVAESHARVRAVINASRQMLYDWNTRTNRIDVDGRVDEIVGLTGEELTTLGGWAQSVHPDDRAAFDAEIDRVLRTREPFQLEYRLRRGDGTYIPVFDHGHFVAGADGDEHMLGLVADLSERKALESQLFHAQKMESIGRLAGGIAHDFNNWLTAIIGHAQIARDAAIAPEVPVALDRVLEAAQSAAGLTRQLVAFARRQVIDPVLSDPTELVDRAGVLLDRLLGETVALEVHAPPRGTLWNIRVDPAQIEQVLVNLAVNARDAMPQGGRLTIELSNVTIDADTARAHRDLTPGEFVQLVVTDSGQGISPDDLPRIFEPFFTTKDKSRGTGLGLPMVLGIVKQSGGHIWVYSEPGLGTTFRIYFPRARRTSEDDLANERAATLAPAPLSAARPGDTVLVVEDDALVRDLVCDVLARRGYTVLAAADGPVAEHMSANHPGPIHLLLTDLVLPSTDGKRLAAALTAQRPEMNVLLTSGYTDLRVGLEPGINYLQKPYGPDQLASTVREVLDRACAPGPTTGSISSPSSA
jgi:two-component system cell cycle sensor histidine kinase/response regulator CckA